MKKPNNKKPQWIKPKLIILVRSDSQEMVLSSCKVPGNQYAGPRVVEAICYLYHGEYPYGYCSCCECTSCS